MNLRQDKEGWYQVTLDHLMKVHWNRNVITSPHFYVKFFSLQYIVYQFLSLYIKDFWFGNTFS